MPAIEASRKDCMAKMRMLDTSQRWPTAAICSTSTSAAIRVMMRLPSSGLGTNGMSVSEHERGNQRERSQNECDHQQFRHPEQAQFCVGGFHQHDQTSKDQQLAEIEKNSDPDSPQRPVGTQAKREERIDQQRHQHELFDGGTPLNQSKVRSRILEDHG